MTYQIKPKNANRFRHDIENLTTQDRIRVWNALKTLSETPQPPGAICLEKNFFRLRVGDLRIIYQVLAEERVILVGAVLKRNERTYRDWYRYFK